MISRRTLMKAGLVLPLTPLALTACSRSDYQMTDTYEEGMYLAGNFGPVYEEMTELDLAVSGTIPEELVGRYLRNGPNPINEVDVSEHHWFLGDGMVHGIRLDNGRAAWYRNRWVRSERVVKALGEKMPPGEIGLGCNTNVIGHAGKTWAIMESGAAPVELTDELATLGPGDWGGYTAHPKVDPDTGELHAICYDWANLMDHVRYVVIDASGNVAKTVDVPLPGMPMIHDMSLTQNYAIVYDLPVTLSFMALGTGASFPFRWDEEYEPRIGLVSRNGNVEDTIWCGMPRSAYAYHPMNAYEASDGKIVIDICRYDRMFAADTLGPFGDSMPRLDRWTVDPSARTVSMEEVDARFQEFPRCHPGLNTKPYRYGYTLMTDGPKFPGILKHDMQTGESSIFDLGPGRHGAEPLFVPKGNAAAEDEGYILTIVYDEASDRSDLVILDAQDSSRPALATVHLPARVPYGFHGNWVADA